MIRCRRPEALMLPNRPACLIKIPISTPHQRVKNKIPHQSKITASRPDSSPSSPSLQVCGWLVALRPRVLAARPPTLRRPGCPWTLPSAKLGPHAPSFTTPGFILRHRTSPSATPGLHPSLLCATPVATVGFWMLRLMILVFPQLNFDVALYDFFGFIHISVHRSSNTKLILLRVLF